jgi:hypothetical protein
MNFRSQCLEAAFAPIFLLQNIRRRGWDPDELLACMVQQKAPPA